MIEVHVTVKDTETNSEVSFVSSSQVGVENKIADAMKFVWVGSISMGGKPAAKKQMTDCEHDWAEIRLRYGNRSPAFVNAISAAEIAANAVTTDQLIAELRNTIGQPY